MAGKRFEYVIVGGGVAGCWAIDGIRSVDKTGSILLAGAEKHLPYDRPPLSKKLWMGTKKVEEIFVHDQQYYREQRADVSLDTTVVKVDPAGKTIACKDGSTYAYGKLLLATGGAPRRLGIPGDMLEGVCYYRTLDDFLGLKARIQDGTRVLVIGGGFIGSEMAAALCANKAEVTLLVREGYICQRVLPDGLGMAIQADYVRRGIKVVTQDSATVITRKGTELATHTTGGREIASQIVVAGVGMEPEVELARAAGLAVENGVVVDELLQTSAPDIYAAGDNTSFPYQALSARMRVEHWDNAVNQGKTAGMNMAGAQTPYTHMPYFFSDMFDFGYEAVGMVSSKLQTVTDWQKENDKGVVYYLQDGRVRGAMMCNVWDKVEVARELIRGGRQVSPKELAGAIK
jgi:3-phenylpropionate/trans-cinnamate dioxygenase ferredoxin reductase component